MCSQSLVVNLIERLRYRYRKFIQRFLATISAIILISFDLFIPAATEAFVPSPVLALVGDTVAFGTTVDLAIIAAPIVIAGVLAAGAVYYVWSQEQTEQAQALAQQKYCAANTTDWVCGGQWPDVPYNVTFEAWTTNGNEGWYPHTIFTFHYGFHEPLGLNDLVTGPIQSVDVLRQLGMDGNYPRMCYGVIDKSGLRCFFEYSNTRYSGTDDYTFKFISLAPLYEQSGNPPPLDWGDWPNDKRYDATNLLTDDDLTPILQSGNAGTLTAGQNLPYGIWTSPGS